VPVPWAEVRSRLIATLSTEGKGENLKIINNSPTVLCCRAFGSES
jgi:hypothetical protein